MTFSFTMTSGLVEPPNTMVCAAAGKAGAASSALVRIAARKLVSRREADAEYLLIPNPDFPRRAMTPAHPDLWPKYRARGHAATARFSLYVQEAPEPLMASLRSVASGRCT
jgi:hypothetical protein